MDEASKALDDWKQFVESMKQGWARIQEDHPTAAVKTDRAIQGPHEAILVIWDHDIGSTFLNPPGGLGSLQSTIKTIQ